MATATARKPRTTTITAVPASVSTQPPLSRSIRSGVTMSIGVIAFPVSVHGAVDSDDTALSGVCLHEGSEHAGTPLSPVKQRKYCPVCDLDHGFAKARKVDAGYVVVPEDVVAESEVADAAAKDNIMLTVHRTAEVNGSMPTGTVYYLNAKSAAAQQSYAVVAALLERRPDLCLIGEFAPRSVASLWQVVADNGVLVMRQLARPELIRQRPQIDVSPDASLVDGLEKFVDATVTGYDPLAYASGRAKKMTAFLSEATPVAAVESQEQPAAETGGVDLSSQLAAALAAIPAPARRSRRKAS